MVDATIYRTVAHHSARVTASDRKPECGWRSHGCPPFLTLLRLENHKVVKRSHAWRKPNPPAPYRNERTARHRPQPRYLDTASQSNEGPLILRLSVATVQTTHIYHTMPPPTRTIYGTQICSAASFSIRSERALPVF